MNLKTPIKITGIGKYLPKKILSEDLEVNFNIPNGWADKNSGVQQRHWTEAESVGYMGAKAAQQALDYSNTNIKEIDLLISAGASFDHIIPNQASVIKSQIKDADEYNFPALDINTTCLSFLTAFQYAAQVLNEKTKKILIVSSEVSSKHLDENNWETLTLFGDAAVAVIVEFDASNESYLIKSEHRTYSKGVNLTKIEGGGIKKPFKFFPYDKELHSFQMKGKNLLKLANIELPKFMDDFFKNTDYEIQNLDKIIPHQASKLGLLLFKKMFSLNNDIVLETLHKYGNCIAASIPLTFVDAIENQIIKRGDICLLCGTSAGFAIGGLLIKY
ncbi:MAG: 3-oxoacyl-[acyl-carrier-protein] synthase III C-terminal domain-containing protein [Flavobacteriales bacterium]|nr:3-oxoacyl-[acyl-carrier-protein] synthase III C-terminal domain-containing protein [Flavobacteriales bacterium]MDG1797862.1 3-oxoacyl-[acyl-carrier-protein] synthase III C-terminal domain-containing protein [Flavobacteriales bacterium]